MCIELRGFFSDSVLHLCVELLRVIVSVHLDVVNYYLDENTAKLLFGEFSADTTPPSTLHPQVIYAIAFSAGLNGLQVYLSDREKDKRASPYTPTSLYCTCSVVQVWPDFTCHAHTINA